MADEDAQLPGERGKQCVEAAAIAGGAEDNLHAQLAIGTQLLDLCVALFRASKQVDLVDADHRLGAAALDGNQVAIDQLGMQRRGHDGHDNDRCVDIRGDHPLDVSIERVPARERGLAGQDHFQHASAAAAEREAHLVTDGEARLLPHGELGPQETLHRLTAAQNDAAARSDGNDEAGMNAGV